MPRPHTSFRQTAHPAATESAFPYYSCCTRIPSRFKETRKNIAASLMVLISQTLKLSYLYEHILYYTRQRDFFHFLLQYLLILQEGRKQQLMCRINSNLSNLQIHLLVLRTTRMHRTILLQLHKWRVKITFFFLCTFLVVGILNLYCQLILCQSSPQRMNHCIRNYVTILESFSPLCIYVTRGSSCLSA